MRSERKNHFKILHYRALVSTLSRYFKKSNFQRIKISHSLVFQNHDKNEPKDKRIRNANVQGRLETLREIWQFGLFQEAGAWRVV